MRYRIFFLFALLAACGPSPAPPSAAPAAPPSGLHFQFSTAALIRGDEDDNVCRGSFPEAQPIFADQVDSKRRWFALGDGLYQVVVDLGTTVASFLVRKKSDTVLEVFTSSQFPECLSKQVYFTLKTDGTGFHYNNQQHIEFDVRAEQAGGVLRIWIEMPPVSQYGLMVRKG